MNTISSAVNCPRGITIPLVIYLLLTISACATPGPSTTQTIEQEKDNVFWQRRQQTLNQLDHWQFIGRFSAKDEQDAWHGKIAWSQSGTSYNIVLQGPFGQGSIKLTGDNQVSELQLSAKENYSNHDPEQLLATHTGISLPFNELRYWIVGLPTTEKHTTQYQIDPQGRLTSLKQQGWFIEFKRYKQITDAGMIIDLPSKLFLENPRYDVRLVIDQWKLTS